jgi:starvation-inducible outer membrane lipoprotein
MKSFIYITFLALCLLLAACSSTPSSSISKDEALFNTYTSAEKKMIRSQHT